MANVNYGGTGYGKIQKGSVNLDELDASVAAALNVDPEVDRVLALRRWFVALASRATAPADILHVGDSITEGYLLSSYLETIPAVALRTIRSRFPIAGVEGGLGYIPVKMKLTNTADFPVSGTPTISINNVFGLGQRSRLCTSAQSFIYAFSGATSVGIRHHRNGASGVAGSLRWKVDEGSWTTVDLKTGTLTDFVETLVTVPDTGAHTLTVEWVAGTVPMDGFFHYNGDESRGIRSWNGGSAGAKIDDFLTGPAATYFQQQLTQIQPSLVTIEIGINDANANPQTTPAAFAASLATMITRIKSNTTITPSIVLIPVWEGGTAVGAARWDDYVSVIYAAANTDPDICVMDWRTRVKPVVGTNDTARGILRGDENPKPTHPSDQGARMLGAALADFVLPR